MLRVRKILVALTASLMGVSSLGYGMPGETGSTNRVDSPVPSGSPAQNPQKTNESNTTKSTQRPVVKPVPTQKQALSKPPATGSQIPTDTRDLMDMITTVPTPSTTEKDKLVKGSSDAVVPVKASIPVAGPHDWLVKNQTIQQLLSLHNQTRATSGLPPLRLNPRMCVDAQKHAVWMAKTGAYQHSGLPYAEIIFAGPTSPEAAVAGWIASPPHYGIMLSGSEAGFGYMVIGGRTYWVGVFR